MYLSHLFIALFLDDHRSVRKPTEPILTVGAAWDYSIDHGLFNQYPYYVVDFATGSHVQKTFCL